VFFLLLFKSNHLALTFSVSVQRVSGTYGAVAAIDPYNAQSFLAASFNAGTVELWEA
jgi:hypothetical protein